MKTTTTACPDRNWLSSQRRGRQGSDVDFYLVVNEQAYEDCLAKDGECVDAHEYSVSPCTEATDT